VLKKFKEWKGEMDEAFYYYVYEKRMGEGYPTGDDQAPRPTLWDWISHYVFNFTLDPILQRARWYMCIVYNHKWVDESYGGPERGGISMWCRRCGYSVHKILY
jgi:hypothetical protein